MASTKFLFSWNFVQVPSVLFYLQRSYFNKL
jgi:hypothetical protein